MQGLGDLACGELAAIIPSLLALIAFGLITGALAFFGLRRGLQP